MNLARSLSVQIGSFLARTGSTIFKTIFVYFATFFLLMHKRELKLYVLHTRIVPREYFVILERRTRDLINGIVRGNLLILFLQIIVATIIFSLFSLPAPVLLGFLYGMLGFLPAIGPALLWIPIIATMLILGQIWSAVALSLTMLGSNVLIDNIIGPRIIGDQTKLHQAIVMFSVLGGISQFGLLGIVLGPTIIALTLICIDIYKDILTATVNSEESAPVHIKRKRKS
jgi:predicted PurR-regulated permease PerM